MLGIQFKKLRTQQNISLKEAAKNVTTVSTLSRWENNQTELQFDKVIELLSNIHISPLEFLSISILSPHTPLIDEIDKAVRSNSIIELKRIATQQLNIFKATQHKDDFLNAAVACNFYYELSGKNIFPDNYKDMLEQYISDVTYWSHYYITIFGNTMEFISPKRIYGFSMLIINNLNVIKKSGYEYFLDTMTTILNGYQLLIQKDINLAEKFSPIINSIQLSEFSIYIKLQISFLNTLLNYKKTGDNAESLSFIFYLKKLGMNSFADQLKEVLDHID